MNLCQKVKDEVNVRITDNYTIIIILPYFIPLAGPGWSTSRRKLGSIKRDIFPPVVDPGLSSRTLHLCCLSVCMSSLFSPNTSHHRFNALVCVGCTMIQNCYALVLPPLFPRVSNAFRVFMQVFMLRCSPETGPSVLVGLDWFSVLPLFKHTLTSLCRAILSYWPVAAQIIYPKWPNIFTYPSVFFVASLSHHEPGYNKDSFDF